MTLNMLQADDLVKGLPDEKLMQEAQNPTHPDVPQVILVAEVKRRLDMRERFKNQPQPDQPTVTDQVLQQGIMSAQQQQVPPQMPNPLPQGPGIAQPPNQFPPMNPPDMGIGAPPPVEGFARGGLVSLAQGGTFPFSRAGLTYQVNKSGYQTDQEAFEAALRGENPWVGDPVTTKGRTNNEITFNPDGSLRSNADMPSEPSGGIINTRHFNSDDYPSMVAGHGNVLPAWMRDEKAPSVGNDYGSNKLTGLPNGPMTGRTVGGIMQEKTGAWYDALADKMQDRAETATRNQNHLFDTEMNPEYKVTDSGKAAAVTPEIEHDTYFDNIAQEGHVSYGDELDPLFGFFDMSNPMGLHWSDAGGVTQKSPVEPDLAAQYAAADKHTKDNSATTGVPAPSEFERLQTEVNDATDAQGVRKNPYAEALDLSQMSDQARKDAFYASMVQLGAGIAAGNSAEGWRNAGITHSRGLKDARDIEMKQKLSEHHRAAKASEWEANETDRTFARTMQKLGYKLDIKRMKSWEAKNANDAAGRKFEVLKLTITSLQDAVDNAPNREAAAAASAQLQEALQELAKMMAE